MQNCSDPYIDSVPHPILIDNTKKIFNETKSYQMVSILKARWIEELEERLK